MQYFKIVFIKVRSSDCFYTTDIHKPSEFKIGNYKNIRPSFLINHKTIIRCFTLKLFYISIYFMITIKIPFNNHY